MGLVNMNLLNYLWETGIKPIKNAIAEKLDSSKAANNLLTTEEGFWLDARQGPVIQGQIDDINSNLSELSDSLSNLFITVTGSKSYTVPANGAIAVTNIPVAVPTGYKAIGISSFNSGNIDVFPVYVFNYRMDVRNIANTNITATASITVLCVKTF